MTIRLEVSSKIPAIDNYLTRANYEHCCECLTAYRKQFPNMWDWYGYTIILTSKGTVEMIKYIPFFGYAPYHLRTSDKDFTWDTFSTGVVSAYTNYLKLVIEGQGSYEEYINNYFPALSIKGICPYFYDDMPNRYSKTWIRSIFSQAQYGLYDSYNRGRIPGWVINDFHRSLNDENLDYILKDQDLDIGVLSSLMDINPAFRVDAKTTSIYKEEISWRKDLIQKMQGHSLYNDPQDLVNRSRTVTYKFPYDIGKEMKRGILLGYL